MSILIVNCKLGNNMRNIVKDVSNTEWSVIEDQSIPETIGEPSVPEFLKSISNRGFSPTHIFQTRLYLTD